MSLRRLAGARSYDRIAGYFCPSIFEVAGEALESVSGPIRMVCNSTIQAKVQEKRKWMAKDRFLEGLAVANILPGATAVQLGIFLGYARGGWWGGLLGGVCFVLPGFFVMLALTIVYAGLGATPIARGAFYGLGPVVLGLFAVAVYRLGRSAASTMPEAVVGVMAAAASIGTPLGIVAILVLAGGVGLLLFQATRPTTLVAAISLVLILAVVAGAWWLPTSALVSAVSVGNPNPKRLLDIGAYFLEVGAFTIGGGLTMIAFIQDQVVRQFGWLTPEEFIGGLALGQLTPGPVLMIAAYVGYNVAGTAGAAVAAAADELLFPQVGDRQRHRVGRPPTRVHEGDVTIEEGGRQLLAVAGDHGHQCLAPDMVLQIPPELGAILRPGGAFIARVGFRDDPLVHGRVHRPGIGLPHEHRVNVLPPVLAVRLPQGPAAGIG
jgi:putative chromate ion transporter